MIDTSLGPYKIIEQLGAGGMGEVYLGEDTRLGRKVAIKVLPAEFASDPERLARFEQEARAAAALNHPHIAVVHDIGFEPRRGPVLTSADRGETASDAAVTDPGDGSRPVRSGDGSAEVPDGVHYMVQEYLEGATLRDQLNKGSLALRRSLELGFEIAEALGAAHDAGIIHRDLKPDNIFVTKDGHAKVLDFGLAKLTEIASIASPGTASMSPTMLGTTAGQVMGTAGYMAPEQVEAAGEIDHRADLFAFGCVLYQMVGGTQPFAGRNVIQTLDRIVNEEPASIEDAVPELPLRLKWIIDKCLAKDPGRRYQHAADVAVDLGRVQREIEGGTAVPAGALSRGWPGQIAEDGRAPSGVGVLRSPATWVLAAIAGASLVVAAWSMSGLLSVEEPPVLRLEVTAPHLQGMRVSYGGALGISPDGLQLITAGLGGSDDMLFHRRLDGTEFSPVPESNNALWPFFSPDGQWIAFFTGNEIVKTSLAGAARQSVAQTTGLQTGASWSVRGEIVYGAAGGIWRVSEDGGEPSLVLAADPEAGVVELSDPDVLPGGNAVLVAVKRDPSATSGERDLAVLTLDSGELEFLGVSGTDPSYVNTGHILYRVPGEVRAVPFDTESSEVTGVPVTIPYDVWVDDPSALNLVVSKSGTLAYISGREVSERPLLWVDRSGGTQRVFEGGLGLPGANDPRLSPDARHVALTANFQVYVVDLATATPTALTRSGDNFYPVWTHDGTRVTFSSGRRGQIAIYTRRVDSNEIAEELLAAENDLRTVSWSQAGGELLVREFTEHGMDLVAYDLDAPESPRALLGSEHDEIGPTVSPDGRWMAYMSTESGRDEIYVGSYPEPTQRIKASNNGGSEPLWSADGSELFYWEGSAFMSVTLRTDPTLEVASRERLFEGFFVRYRWHAQYDVHPDGERFLMIGAPRGESQIAIVLNWFEELKRLAPAER